MAKKKKTAGKPKKAETVKPKARKKTYAQRMAAIRKLRGNRWTGAVNKEAERRRTMWRRQNPGYNVPPLRGFVDQVKMDLAK